ncbi:hypothetical protein CCMSSC00406_0006703 [Pleurotus cornucopiae]|uniref:Uncharacterized protein n=1 Tax=Pleurotus cornucopiae TaxID=5321 RepID=A0ACB7IVK1_PLECO|nr:hypothetical protein CCMSSC00406_0006703 [Pleurotus cornucopiae]
MRWGQTYLWTQILEDTIADLNARIEELERSESGQSSAPGIVLHQPYDDPIGSTSSYPGSPGHLQPSAPSISSRISSSIQQRAGSLESQLEEPPQQERQALLDSFLSHASQFGFFLDRQRFRQSAMLPLPLGDHSRPSPSLLATAYLIGHTLSQQGGFSQLESSLLTDALRATATMAFDTHPHHVIHRTQVEILLSNYFFRNARFLEARHHASNACSLAAACSLHRLEIVSGNVAVEAPQTQLPPPSDESEIVERIAAFWAVYALHNLWSASLSTPISLSFDVTSQINIPWPSEVDRERRPVGGELDFASNDIVRRYLAGDQDQSIAGSGLPALFTKTSVLFERATNLSARFTSADQIGDAEAMSRELDTLTILVESIRSQLPSLTPILDSNFPSMRLAVVTHALVDATVIKLNAPFSQQDQAALQRCISAAQRIINSADNPLLLQLGVVNPIMAVVWPMACQVIMHEIVRLQVNRAVWTQGHPSDEELQRRSEVEVCIQIMGAFTAQSSFMDTQLSKVQLAYANINT